MSDPTIRDLVSPEDGESTLAAESIAIVREKPADVAQHVSDPEAMAKKAGTARLLEVLRARSAVYGDGNRFFATDDGDVPHILEVRGFGQDQEMSRIHPVLKRPCLGCQRPMWGPGEVETEAGGYHGACWLLLQQAQLTAITEGNP